MGRARAAIEPGTTIGDGRARVAAIDGIRGVAACYVLMHHVWQYAIASSSTDPPSWFKAATVFKYGSYAVAVFIVVSGYCLTRPVVGRIDLSRGGPWLRRFAWRRARRLLPPYGLALAASMALIGSQAILRRPSGTPWDITLPSFTSGKVVSHLLLVHNWSRDWEYGFNPPFWSIGLEVQIYVVFALLMLPLWRRFGLPAVVAAAAVIAVVATALDRGPYAPWMVLLFAMGLVVAARPAPIVALGELAAGRGARWLGALGAVVLVVGVTATTGGLSPHVADFARHVAVGLVAAVGMAVIDGQRATGRAPGRIAAALGSRPGEWLGVRSYSLYLTHYPLVALVALRLADATDLTVPQAFVFLTVTTVPASLALAIGFHHLVERPFLNAPGSAATSGESRPALSRA